MTDFQMGYILACSNLVHAHDEPGMAADLMADLGLRWEDIKRANLGPYDMEAMRKIRKEGGGRAFATEAQQKEKP